jgi:DNA-binding transcriptional LysR family regulator
MDPDLLPDLLTDMATFAAVVEHNSFSVAADALNTSKSNVSRRVASLENRLGLKLLHRTTRRLDLTESGRLYYAHCERMMNEARDADRAVRLMHSAPSGTLNISLPETLGRAHILPLLPDFLRRYPDIQLNVTITSRKVDLAEEGFDVALRKGAVDDESLTAVPLGSSTQLLYASRDYLSHRSAPQEPDDLQHHDILSSRITNGPADMFLWRGNEVVKVRVVPRLALKDHDALLAMTLSGLGVALLPEWMARAHVHEGRLVPVLQAFRGPSVDFNLVFQPHRGMAPNLRAFVEFVTDRFALNRPWDSQNKDQRLTPPSSPIPRPIPSPIPKAQKS